MSDYKVTVSEDVFDVKVDGDQYTVTVASFVPGMELRNIGLGAELVDDDQSTASLGLFRTISGTANEVEVAVGGIGNNEVVIGLPDNITTNVTGTVSSLSNHDSDDLSEGTTNLYYTDDKVNTRVRAYLQGEHNASIYPSTDGTLVLGDPNRKYGQLWVEDARLESLETPLGTGDIVVKNSLVPDTTLTHNLGSPTKAWHSAYVGPGSLYIDGQKVLGSDADGDIDITTDSGQNLHFSSGADIILLPQAGEVDQGFRVELDRIELGPNGNTATVEIKGLLEAPDLHIGELEIEEGLINNTSTNGNLEIRTDGIGYLHANIGGAAYFGAFSSAISLDGASKTVSAIGGDISIGSNANTLNLNTTGTLDVSGDTTLAGLTVEGSNSDKSTVVGDSLIAGTYASHGFTINADDTSWASITLEEYVGSTNKPIDSFSNATIAAEVYGGTPGAKTNVVSGKRLLNIQGLAANQSDGSLPSFANFRIKSETTEDQTLTNRGTELTFETTANGDSNTTETLMLQGNTISVNAGGDGVITSGGDLTLDADVSVENVFTAKARADFESVVNLDSTLDVDGNTQLNADLTVNGSTVLGDDNTTDTITMNGRIICNGVYELLRLDTATLQYYAGLEAAGYITINEGAMCWATDGDSGTGCVAVYDGTNFKRISLGSNISST